MNRYIGRCVVVALTFAVIVAVSPRPAQAQSVCFSGFGGTVFYVLNLGNILQVNRVLTPISGRVSGALSACAGLSEWPLVGAAVLNAAGTQAILAFRGFTVDAASCGATDNIAVFTLATGTGPMQLNNVRNSFTNSTTVTIISCAAAPPSTADETAGSPSMLAAGEIDAFGNGGP